MIVSYDATLVFLSVSVAIMGSFTGLLIMSRVGGLTGAFYKLKIAAGAVTIGSSIWSMHFIGMLALGLPIPLGYDGLITTISAFIAVLLTGLGLYAASSGHIRRGALLVGGLLMGSGIAGMHYMGMSAVRASCIITYEPLGVVASVVVGIIASSLALTFAFRERGPLETVIGAVALGLAISAMHYSAMLATFLVHSNDVVIVGPVLSQQNVAFIVAIATFLICGLCLLIALPDKKSEDSTILKLSPPLKSTFENPSADRVKVTDVEEPVRIPVRRNNSTFFAGQDNILAVRADGHYSWVMVRSKSGGIDEHFCERSISTLAKQLVKPQFVRAHRSHIVNIEQVMAFRRHGDGALLLLDADGTVSVPVSRAHLHQVLRRLEGDIDIETRMPDAAPA